MLRVRLRAIIFDSDFRKNEVSLYEQFRRNKKRFPGERKAGECDLFISKQRNQLIWFVSETPLETTRGRPVVAVHSFRSRLDHSGWNPQMLANYAKAVGIDLVGIRRFEDAFMDERKRKANERIKAEAEKALLEVRKLRSSGRYVQNMPMAAAAS
jgi:hypothetical protein